MGMEKKQTKREMILETALTLFAEKGFDATSVDEIGSAMNMRGPALYHYFKGKEDLLNGLIEMVETRYTSHFGAADQIERFPENLEEFMNMSLDRLNFTIQDPLVQKVRRVFTMEQFRREDMRKLATQHQLTLVRKLNTRFFEKLVENGSVKSYDPSLLAFEFSTPISLLIQYIDREPDKYEEAMKRIRQHMDHFMEIYGVKNS